MTSTTIEGDVVTGERLIDDIDFKRGVPCDLQSFHEQHGIPTADAKWRIYWNRANMCGCQWTATSHICQYCLDILMRSTGVQCMRCMRRTRRSDAIKRIEPL